MLLPYDEFNRLFNIVQKRINEEIKINPEYIYYDISMRASSIYRDKFDYICDFGINGSAYIIMLMYYPINGVETYHIVFTTMGQYHKFEREKIRLGSKGYITDDEHKYLDSIISEETNLNDIFEILKKISWLIFDVHKKYIPEYKLSLVNTENKKKIKIYRNIIKNSFDNVTETGVKLSDNDYFIYEIK